MFVSVYMSRGSACVLGLIFIYNTIKQGKAKSAVVRPSKSKALRHFARAPRQIAAVPWFISNPANELDVELKLNLI